MSKLGDIAAFLFIWFIVWGAILYFAGHMFWIPKSYWERYNFETLPLSVWWEYILPHAIEVAVVSLFITIIFCLWVLHEDGVI